MALTAVKLLAVLISNLTWTHLDPYPIHCGHKPTTHNGNNPLRHRIFIPAIFHTWHQSEEYKTGGIVASPPTAKHLGSPQ
jgi:hypothetical protein